MLQSKAQTRGWCSASVLCHSHVPSLGIFFRLPFDDLITVDVPTETQTERGTDEIETTGRQEEKSQECGA
jgi:hypothetical protein